MSSEGLSVSVDPDAVAKRPASNLLLAGTGLSLALAVSAVVGLPNNDQVPASQVQGDLAADRNVPQTLGAARISPGQVTVDEMAAATLAPPDFAASLAGPPLAAVGAANSNTALGRSQTTATAPQPSGQAVHAPVAPASSISQIVVDDSSSSYGDGRAEPGDGPASPAHAGAAASGLGSGGLAAGSGSSASNGDSHAGQPAGGSGGDDSGDSDEHGDHGSHGHGGHGGHHSG